VSKLVGVGCGCHAPAGRSLTIWSVASRMEVDEGRWGGSESHTGSVKVGCKSAWLLHFAAALLIRLAMALDNSTAYRIEPSHRAESGAPDRGEGV
jgi:hypothetical protein